jgi:hypothetical protein
MTTAARARELLSKHGTVETQERSDWMGEVPLPEPIARFYEEVGPSDVVIVTGGEPYFFPRLTSLWDMQAGYRWHALSGEPVTDWDPDLLVIVDRIGDPILYSLSRGTIRTRSGSAEFDSLYAVAESLAVRHWGET